MAMAFLLLFLVTSFVVLPLCSCNVVNGTKQIKKYCNLCHVFHQGIVDDIKQIRNQHRVFHCSIVDGTRKSMNDDEFFGF